MGLVYRDWLKYVALKLSILCKVTQIIQETIIIMRKNAFYGQVFSIFQRYTPFLSTILGGKL